MKAHVREQKTEAQIEAEIAERERKQFDKMTKTPIARLVIGLGIPTMLNMMVTSLYNLADTYFVTGLGQQATGAVNVVLSLMSIIQAIGFTFGMGSGSIVSKLLGARKREEADKVASTAFFTAGAIGVLILLFGMLFLSPLMRLLGAPSETGVETTTLAYAKEYSTWILFAAPFMCMSFVLNNVLRAEGKAVLSMAGLVSGAVINVALDPILIYGADMGIAGAGIATCVSQVISFAILLGMFLTGKTVVRMRVRSIARQFAVYFDVIATGFPSFCRQILASLCTVMLNWAVKPYDGALAALGIVQKVFMVAFSISLGIGQGYQPVLGYNHSAKRYDRVRGAYLFTLVFSMSLMSVFAIVCAIFAPNLMRAFNQTDNATKIGALSLRLQCICMPLLPVNFMISITYQTVGNKGIASLLSVSRQGLFYIPAVLILPKVAGLFGVQCCQSVSDAFSFLFALPFTYLFFKSLKQAQAAQLLENEKIGNE
ncbi:MAG: MATE family efflux transporter [Clostridia bacterium]|nr:MATE family efflux transporter [Clostridia bacterium]